MEERKRFPILSQMAKAVLVIPATSTSSERMWGRRDKILSVKTARLKPNITLATMFIAENVELRRKHYGCENRQQSDATVPAGGWGAGFSCTHGRRSRSFLV